MQPVVMAIGGVIIIGGVLGIIWSRRTEYRRGRAASSYTCAWSTAAVWFGTLPIIEATHLPAKLQDIANAIVMCGGLSVTLWFVAAGVRARRAEFHDLRRECLDEGAPAPRYFWSPWAIFGWTLVLGGVLVFGGGFAVASVVGAVVDHSTIDEVERTAQALANVIAACAFALLPIAAAAGLWRWWRLRTEGHELPAVS